MAEHPQPHTGRPASPATINRKLSAIANFYKYGIEDVELLTYSPVANVKRETVGEDSPMSGLSALQLDHFLTAAENESPTAAALPTRAPSSDRRAPGRSTRIMVIMPGDAASDATPASALVSRGERGVRRQVMRSAC